MVSDFFRLKIAAYERRNEKLVFDYKDFDSSTVRLFLDAVYKIDVVKKLDVLSVLKLIDFLKWEGKNMFSGNGMFSTVRLL